MGLFKPAWENPDDLKRKIAVQKLNPKKQGVIIDLAKNDNCREIRFIAIQKLSDWDTLKKIITDVKNEEERKLAVDQIVGDDKLYVIAVAYPAIYRVFDSTANYATEKINDQNLLKKIVFDSPYTQARFTALRKIVSPNILSEIVNKVISCQIKAEAYRLLGDSANMQKNLALSGDIRAIEDLRIDKRLLAEIVEKKALPLGSRLHALCLLYSEAHTYEAAIITILGHPKITEDHRYTWVDDMGKEGWDAFAEGWYKREKAAKSLADVAQCNPPWLYPFWDEIATEVQKERTNKTVNQVYGDRDQPYDIDELHGLGIIFSPKLAGIMVALVAVTVLIILLAHNSRTLRSPSVELKENMIAQVVRQWNNIEADEQIKQSDIQRFQSPLRIIGNVPSPIDESLNIRDCHYEYFTGGVKISTRGDIETLEDIKGMTSLLELGLIYQRITDLTDISALRLSTLDIQR